MMMTPSVCPVLIPPDTWFGPAVRAALLVAAVVAVTVLAPAANAEERLLTLDPEASSVTFTLDAIMHKVDGSFHLVSGEIRFDPATGDASGEVVIDALSGDTGNGRRDRRMHRQILDSERFTRIVLVPTAFSGSLGASGGGVMLSGELEAHGHRRSVDIPAWVNGIENGRLSASGGFTMPYTAWGIPDPSGFFLRVSDEVDVQLEIVGDLSTPEPAAEAAQPPPAQQPPAGSRPMQQPPAGSRPMQQPPARQPSAMPPPSPTQRPPAAAPSAAPTTPEPAAEPATAAPEREAPAAEPPAPAAEPPAGSDATDDDAPEAPPPGRR